MTNCKTTDSERVFADICSALGYAVEKIPESPPAKTPDFKIEVGECFVFVEVKQFEISKPGQAIEDKLNRGEVHVEEVDFRHDGGLGRKLNQQAAQLQASCRLGFPTLGVIYSNRFLGPTDYQVQHALRNDSIVIPKEISAVLYVKNENLSGEGPPFVLYRNPSAAVPFPNGLF